MKNKLLYKLLGAFLLVIAFGNLGMSLMISQSTKNAFNMYTTRSGQIWSQRLAPVLTDYYQQNNDWRGVDAFVKTFLDQDASLGDGTMMGQGHGSGKGQQGFSSGMMGLLGQRLILVDSSGVVLSDTTAELLGEHVSSIDLKKGTVLTVDNKPVGTLLITPDLSGYGTPASEFLSSVQRAIISSTIIAVIIALVLGAALFFQIISPLRQLRKAAIAIAAGDLSQKVNIRSKDEFGELGSTFNKMAEELSRAESQRQQMTADIAHELRTPLAAIQGTLEGMQDGILPLDEDQLTSLTAETMLLNRLIGDLRLLTLAEAGQLKLDLKVTNLAELIFQVTEQLKNQVEQKSVRLETEIQSGLPLVKVDPDRFTQILNNLVGNSLRYTPADGVIRIYVTQPINENKIHVSVIDTGLGITREDLPLIFGRFYRADRSRSRSSGGSGLGLAIVKQLVEAHGGKIEAISPVFNNSDGIGFGTEITFTLPVFEKE